MCLLASHRTNEWNWMSSQLVRAAAAWVCTKKAQARLAWNYCMPCWRGRKVGWHEIGCLLTWCGWPGFSWHGFAQSRHTLGWMSSGRRQHGFAQRRHRLGWDGIACLLILSVQLYKEGASSAVFGRYSHTASIAELKDATRISHVKSFPALATATSTSASFSSSNGPSGQPLGVILPRNPALAISRHKNKSS